SATFMPAANVAININVRRSAMATPRLPQKTATQKHRRTPRNAEKHERTKTENFGRYFLWSSVFFCGAFSGSSRRSTACRRHRRFAPAAAIRSSPSLRVIAGIVDVIHAERPCRIHIEESCLRAERRRRPVGGTSLIRRDECAINLRVLRRIRDRLSPVVVAERPVRLRVVARHERLPIRAVEDEEVSV